MPLYLPIMCYTRGYTCTHLRNIFTLVRSEWFLNLVPNQAKLQYIGKLTLQFQVQFQLVWFINLVKIKVPDQQNIKKNGIMHRHHEMWRSNAGNTKQYF